ncbi:aspartate/glutamate racemase family protein [Candidatus Saccharibacteria bacterium]|nr:aspartate/glutamate racemase family protein [Candidatus Saccharibacteria bacterium]
MNTSNYPEEIDEINRIIFEELCHGIVTPESKEFMMNFAYQFPADSDERPDAIILGCTELNMILEPDDVDVPLVDSTQAHIDKLVELCLS